jgi:hypothetical protein
MIIEKINHISIRFKRCVHRIALEVVSLCSDDSIIPANTIELPLKETDVFLNSTDVQDSLFSSSNPFLPISLDVIVERLEDVILKLDTLNIQSDHFYNFWYLP